MFFVVRFFELSTFSPKNRSALRTCLCVASFFTSLNFTG